MQRARPAGVRLTMSASTRTIGDAPRRRSRWRPWLTLGAIYALFSLIVGVIFYIFAVALSAQGFDGQGPASPLSALSLLIPIAWSAGALRFARRIDPRLSVSATAAVVVGAWTFTSFPVIVVVGNAL